MATRRRGYACPGLFERARGSNAHTSEPPARAPTGWLCTFCGSDAAGRMRRRDEYDRDYTNYVREVHPFRACFERATGRPLLVPAAVQEVLDDRDREWRDPRGWTRALWDAVNAPTRAAEQDGPDLRAAGRSAT